MFITIYQMVVRLPWRILYRGRDDGYYTVDDSSFQSVRIAGWDGYEEYRDGTFDWVVGSENSDKLYSSAIERYSFRSWSYL